jgi:hypothetical protein
MDPCMVFAFRNGELIVPTSTEERFQEVGEVGPSGGGLAKLMTRQERANGAGRSKAGRIVTNQPRRRPGPAA